MARKPAPSTSPSPTPVCAAYIRVSRVGGRGEPGEGEFLSPTLQREEARKLATFKGWHFDDELTTNATDLDVSGRKGNLHKRSGLATLLEAAEAGRVQHVIVYKLSRLARSAREGLEIFDQFEALGVAVHVVKEGIDSSTASGRMIRTMLLGVAEMQSEDIAQFVRDAARQRAMSGRPHRVPGWIRRGESGAYELVPELAASMRRMIELRLSGLSYASIAGVLNAEERPSFTKAIWRASNVGRYLAPENLSRLIGTSVYNGDLSASDSRRIEIKDAFPALLTKEELSQLESVQAVLLADIPFGNTPGKPAGHTHAPLLATGLLICSICESPMYVTRQQQKRKDGEKAYNYICPGPGELGIAHPVYGRSMAKSATGQPDQRQMSLSGEAVEAAILEALLLYARLLEPTLDPETSTQKTTCGLTTCGKTTCGKVPCGKPSVAPSTETHKNRENQAHTRARARSSSSSLSISSVIESKTYNRDDDDDLLERVHTTASARVSAIVRELDDLFDLRSASRISEGDFDRRYQKLSNEREELLARQAQIDAKRAARVGASQLSVLARQLSGGVIGAETMNAWKLTTRLLFLRITAPLFLPESMARVSRGERPRRALACWLRDPLGNGEGSNLRSGVVIVSGLYRSSWQGSRFCQIFTQTEYDQIVKNNGHTTGS